MTVKCSNWIRVYGWTLLVSLGTVSLAAAGQELEPVAAAPEPAHAVDRGAAVERHAAVDVGRGASNTAAAAGVCGAPESGSCFTVHATPGCDDAACCNTVCAQDPFCCDTQWDNFCVGTANLVCGCGAPASEDCFAVHNTPWCNDAACCNIVCAADPFCCESAWDILCRDAAVAQCGCGASQSGSCFIAHGTPWCDSAACCSIVCAADPFCCSTQWDNLCASAATAQCGCAAPQSGDCFTAHETPWCNDAACCNAVCATDPFCCDTAWTADCVAAAIAQCGCGTPESGDCFTAHETPWCDDPVCCSLICAADPFCCDTAWTADCAAAAIAQCGCGAAQSGDCFTEHETPWCNDSACCNAVCATDPFCCDTAWTADCVAAAIAQCGCGTPESGDCFTAHETPWCNDSACCSLICAQDPFCCDTAWTADCAAAATAQCGCGAPESGDCFTAHATPWCDDSACCSIICSQDPFCCETQWDAGCATAAQTLCVKCGGADEQCNSLLLYDNGFAKACTGFFSQANFLSADDFVLEEDFEINDIHVYFLESIDRWTGDIHLEIWSHDEGACLPLSQVASQDHGANFASPGIVMRTDLGPASIFGYNLIRYDIECISIPLPAGRYWLAVAPYGGSFVRYWAANRCEEEGEIVLGCGAVHDSASGQAYKWATVFTDEGDTFEIDLNFQLTTCAAAGGEPNCLGDACGACDGVVDVFDLLATLDNFGSSSPECGSSCTSQTCLPGNSNMDCTVDVFDMLDTLNNFGLSTFGGCASGPSNDDVENATFLPGEGTYDYSLANATTDGPATNLCDPGLPDNLLDVWFCLQAECDGFITIQNSQNTPIIVYESAGGLGCSGALGAEIRCDSDGQLVSEAEAIDVEEGNHYVIRILDSAESNGTISIDCIPLCALIQCPPGSQQEGEPCVTGAADEINTGCNSPAADFGAITINGPAVCGVASTYTELDESRRDTDWYEFTLAGGESVTMHFIGDFEGLFGIVCNSSNDITDCTGTLAFCHDNPGMMIAPCTPAEATFTNPDPANPGTFAAFVASWNFGGLECSDEKFHPGNYVITLTSP